MARMLGDVDPPDLAEKIQQVKAVVPSRSEEEVSIALHDNDFNIEKAITALLDSDEDQGQVRCMYISSSLVPRPSPTYSTNVGSYPGLLPHL